MGKSTVLIYGFGSTKNVDPPPEGFAPPALFVLRLPLLLYAPGPEVKLPKVPDLPGRRLEGFLFGEAARRPHADIMGAGYYVFFCVLISARPRSTSSASPSISRP